MNRREFLEKTLLTTAATATMPFLVQGEVASKTFDPYAQITLGRTGLQFSRMALGTGVKGGSRESNHTRMGKEKFTSLIRGAYDRGVNTFDLADLYGTHPLVIPALKGIARDKIRIITKMWFRSGGLPEAERPDADAVVPRFLSELGTDHIDLMLLHCVTSAKWPEELRKQMDILSRFKSKGAIRALGVSCHSLEALGAAAAEPWVDSVHARINPFGMNMDAAVDQVVPVIKRIHDSGKGIVGMKIVGEGKLSNQPEKLDQSIRFVLNLGAVDILNIGCESLEQIDDFAERVRKVPVV